jgi:hypothetical protein
MANVHPAPVFLRRESVEESDRMLPRDRTRIAATESSVPPPRLV